MEPFIANRVENALRKQEKYTLFSLASTKVFKQSKSFGFIEWWALAFLVLSILAYCLSFAITHWVFQIVVLILVVLRVWEYVPYIFRVAIFTQPNKGQTDILDARRSVILVLSNYLEMTFWLAACYSILFSRGLFKIIAGAPPIIAIFRESVMSMVANSSGSFVEMSACVWSVMTLQNVFGLIVTILVVARVISFLPQPSTGAAADPPG